MKNSHILGSQLRSSWIVASFMLFALLLSFFIHSKFVFADAACDYCQLIESMEPGSSCACDPGSTPPNSNGACGGSGDCVAYQDPQGACQSICTNGSSCTGFGGFVDPSYCSSGGSEQPYAGNIGGVCNGYTCSDGSCVADASQCPGGGGCEAGIACSETCPCPNPTDICFSPGNPNSYCASGGGGTSCTTLTYSAPSSGFSASPVPTSGNPGSSLSINTSQTSFYAYVDYGAQTTNIQPPIAPGSRACAFNKWTTDAASPKHVSTASFGSVAEFICSTPAIGSYTYATDMNNIPDPLLCQLPSQTMGTVTVTGSGPSVTVNLSANPTTVLSGNSSTLTWTVTNATSCVDNKGNMPNGNWKTGQSGSASTGSLTSNHTYQITCTGGSQASASATVIITVTPGGGTDGQCGTACKTYPFGASSYGGDTFCSVGTANPNPPAFPTAGACVPWTCQGLPGNAFLGIPAGADAPGQACQASGNYSLTVTPSIGGTVTSNDGNINCGATCSKTYTPNATVTLQEAPASIYWQFVGWQGDCSGTATSFNLTINGSKTCSAKFVPRPFLYQEF